MKEQAKSIPSRSVIPRRESWQQNKEELSQGGLSSASRTQSNAPDETQPNFGMRRPFTIKNQQRGRKTKPVPKAANQTLDVQHRKFDASLGLSEK